MSHKQICNSADDHLAHRAQTQPGIIALPCACGRSNCCGYALVINNHWQIQIHAGMYAPKEWEKEHFDILYRITLRSTFNYMPMYGGGFLGKQELLPFNNPISL